jgi:glycosyltransferase involved in cell wall biosynthesis
MELGKRVLALGNTASVMSTMALSLPNLSVASPPSNGQPVIDSDSSIRVVRELTYPSSVSLLGFVGRERRNYDLFHAELGYSLACLRASVPFGIHLHGVTDIQLLFPSSVLGRLLKNPYAKALSAAEYVVCHEAITDEIQTIRRDASSLASPIDTVRFNPSVSPLRLGQGLTFFSPSRMDKWKGHETTWRALSMMKNHDRVKVYQSDWGWEPEYFSLKRSAPSNVKFIRVIPRSEIQHYYRGSDVVVGQMKIGYPGMVELEAAASGVPVTVYSKNSDTPFLPKRADAKELADLLDRLVEDDQFRSDYANRCRDFVISNHSLEKTAADFAAIVQMAAAHRRPNYEFGLHDLGHLELGTGLELIEKGTSGSPVSAIRARLLGL